MIHRHDQSPLVRPHLGPNIFRLKPFWLKAFFAQTPTRANTERDDRPCSSWRDLKRTIARIPPCGLGRRATNRDAASVGMLPYASHSIMRRITMEMVVKSMRRRRGARVGCNEAQTGGPRWLQCSFAAMFAAGRNSRSYAHFPFFVAKRGLGGCCCRSPRVCVFGRGAACRGAVLRFVVWRVCGVRGDATYVRARACLAFVWVGWGRG